MHAILDSGKFLEVCEALFKKIDFIVYTLEDLNITTPLKLQTIEQTNYKPILAFGPNRCSLG